MFLCNNMCVYIYIIEHLECSLKTEFFYFVQDHVYNMVTLPNGK